MALTGTGIRIGTATSFDVGERFPRALASDGTQVILFGSRKGYLLDPATGAATVIGTIDNFGRSEQQCRSATYHNGGFVFWGNGRKTIYNYDPTDGTTSDAHGNPLTIQNTNTNPDLWGIASSGGVLYALDRPSAKLYTVDLTQNEIVPIGDATDYGLAGSPNIQGFTDFAGELIGVSTGLDQLVRFNKTTGVATLISANSLPDASSEALVDHNGQLLMAGSSADALFRLYDVLWNETIADLEVDEGANETWSLSGISQDAASFSLPSNTRSWLAVSGTDLVATTAPAVDADTNNDVTTRATRDGINVDKTLRIVVRNTATPPPPALTFGTGAISNQAWEVGTAITSLTLPEATGGTGNKTYSLTPTTPAGVTFTAGTRLLSGNPTGRFTSTTFTYTATDGNGDTVELTFTVVVTATEISFASTVANQAWLVGTPVNLTLPTATGGVGSFTYSLTPALPSGVSFTAATRALSGNPTATATVATYTYTATDSENVTHTETFTIVVTATAITFDSTIAAQAWVVGTAISVTLPTASGGVGDKTYSLTPTLPGGTTFTAGTRALAGTPTGRFASTTYTYTVTDSEGVTQTQTFTVVVTATAITFSPTAFTNQSWVVGTAVAETLPAGAGGVGNLTASLSPTTPAGVTFTAATRALAGNPSATFTSATFTYTMTDEEGIAESITFTIVVSATPNIAPDFADSTYTFNDTAIAINAVIGTVTATDADNDPLTYTLTGTDASKFSIATSGQITIAETLSYGETYTFSVRANDGTVNTDVAVAVTTDTTTPRAPTVTVNSASHNSITIDIAHGNDGGETVTDWEYELNGNGTWNSFGSTNAQQTISSLQDDTSYSIKVRGINSNGNGIASTAVTRSTSAAPNTAPAFGQSAYTFTDTQINLNATIGIVSATDADDDTLTYSLTGTNASDFSIDANGQITSAVALAYDTTYTFNVVANDGEDTTTVTVSVTTREEPTTATVPQVITAVQVQNRTIVRWEAPEDLNMGTLERYELRIDREAWIQGNTEEYHTLLDLGIGEHIIEVSAITEAGRGEIAEITHTVRFEATPQEQIQTYTFETRDGQTLSQILHQEFTYINTELLSEVLDLNPGLANEPLKLTIGIKIKLPVKQTPTAQTIPVQTLWD